MLLHYLSKFQRADWLVATVHKTTDNKNDVRCNALAFLTENRANSARTFFHAGVKNKSKAVFYGLYSYIP